MTLFPDNLFGEPSTPIEGVPLQPREVIPRTPTTPRPGGLFDDGLFSPEGIEGDRTARRLEQAHADWVAAEKKAQEYEGLMNMTGKTIAALPKAIKDTILNPVSLLRGAGRGLVTGATLGFIQPERMRILAEEETEVERAARRGFDFAGTFLPFTRLAKLIRGGMGLTKTGARALQSKTMLARSLVMGTEAGASASMVTLFSQPREDKVVTLKERLTGAAVALPLGFGLGALLPPAGHLARYVYQGIRRKPPEVLKVGVPKERPPLDLEPAPPMSPAERAAAKALAKERARHPQQPKTIPDQPFEHPPLAIADEIAVARDAMTKKGLTPSQQRFMQKHYLPTGTLNPYSGVSGAEVRNFTKIVNSVLPGKDGKIKFSRSTAIVPRELAEKEIGKIGLIDFFRPPQKVFERIGLGETSKVTFDAFRQRADWLAMKSAEVAGWQKSLGITRLGQLLRGTAVREQSSRMFRAINNPEEKIVLSAPEQTVVTQVRMLMNTLADMVDAANKQIGLPAMNRKQNYITNLLNATGREWLRQTKLPPNELYALAQERLPLSVFNRLLLQRKGGLPIKEDIWASLDAAMKMHSKYAFISPPVHSFGRAVRFLGDKLSPGTAKYIRGQMHYFLGRPGQVEQYLRATDESISTILGKFPGLGKNVSVEFIDGFKEMMRVPLIRADTPIVGLLFPSRVLPALKMVTYWSHLAGSVSYYVLNLTQFWQNVPGILRGSFITRYSSAVEGYVKMMNDFVRPSRWAKWKREGVLTEIDNFVTLEMQSSRGFIPDAMNLFTKLSEFNNRVSAVYAVDANVRRLAQQGRVAELWPELAKIFGGDARKLGRHIADLTQFRFGREAKPALFQNPITDMFHQYNTFALNQAELVFGMAKKLQARGLLKDFSHAVKAGKGWDFIRGVTQGERGEIIRYVINVSGLIYVLNAMGGSFFRAIGRGVEPSWIEGIMTFGDGLIDGDAERMRRGLFITLVPTAFRPLLDREPERMLPARTLARNMDIAYQLMSDEDAIRIMTNDGVHLNRMLTRDEAFKEIIFGAGRVPDFDERRKVFSGVRDVERLARLRREDEWGTAREIIEKHIRGQDQETAASNLVFLLEEGIINDSVLEKMNTLIEEETLEIGVIERSIRSIGRNEDKALYILKQREYMGEEE